MCCCPGAVPEPSLAASKVHCPSAAFPSHLGPWGWPCTIASRDLSPPRSFCLCRSHTAPELRFYSCAQELANFFCRVPRASAPHPAGDGRVHRSWSCCWWDEAPAAVSSVPSILLTPSAHNSSVPARDCWVERPR